MKNFVFVATCMMLLGSGCLKDEKGCTPVTPASEEGTIVAYAAANNITATKHSSGIYYQIVNSGTGETPTATSNVTVNYVGKLLNGNTFDSSRAPISFPLNGVIEGWGIGIPLIKEGGTIKLIIPSSLAYGCNGRSPIGPNDILFFEVDLLDVQ